MSALPQNSQRPQRRLSRVCAHFLPKSLPCRVRPAAVSGPHSLLTNKHTYKPVTASVINDITKATDSERVFTDGKEIPKHSVDHSYHAGVAPALVVYPTSPEEVAKVVKICYDNYVPVTACGARTGLEGGAIPTHGGVVIDVTRMNQVVELKRAELHVTVQAGMRKNALNNWLKPHGLFFVVDPASNPSVGGQAATGGSGTLCVKYGTMNENLVSLKVVLADGRIVQTRARTRKSSTGYDLTRLFAGQEGTLGIIVEVTVKVLPLPKATCTALVPFPSLYDATQAVADMQQASVKLSRCELMNETAVRSTNAHFKTKFPLSSLLLLEFDGATDEEVLTEAGKARALAVKRGASKFEYATDQKERLLMWKARKGAYYASLFSTRFKRKAKTKVLLTDVCVPLSKLAQCIVETEEDFSRSKHQFVCNIVGHVGDGNFHVMVPFAPSIQAEAEELEELNRRLQHRAIVMGGTVSGEHGIGIGKISGAAEEHGPVVLDIFRTLKNALDPRHILNPGKMFV